MRRLEAMSVALVREILASEMWAWSGNVCTHLTQILSLGIWDILLGGRRKQLTDGLWTAARLLQRLPQKESDTVLLGSGPCLDISKVADTKRGLWYSHESKCLVAADSLVGIANLSTQWSMVIDFLMLHRQSHLSGINLTSLWPILFARFCLIIFYSEFLHLCS